MALARRAGYLSAGFARTQAGISNKSSPLAGSLATLSMKALRRAVFASAPVPTGGLQRGQHVGIEAQGRALIVFRHIVFLLRVCLQGRAASSGCG